MCYCQPPALYRNYIYVTDTRGVRTMDSQYVVFLALTSSQLDDRTGQLRLGTLRPSVSRSSFAAAGISGSVQISVRSLWGSNLAP